MSDTAMGIGVAGSAVIAGFAIALLIAALVRYGDIAAWCDSNLDGNDKGMVSQIGGTP